MLKKNFSENSIGSTFFILILIFFFNSLLFFYLPYNQIISYFHIYYNIIVIVTIENKKLHLSLRSQKPHPLLSSTYYIYRKKLSHFRHHTTQLPCAATIIVVIGDFNSLSFKLLKLGLCDDGSQHLFSSWSQVHFFRWLLQV